MGELSKIENYCELSKTKLTFKRDVSKEEWMDVFKSLKQVEGCVQFWIGDCLTYRQQKWGMYDDIAEETGYDVGYLKNLKSVADNVESSHRCDDLSWTHHREVASLTPEKQELFLNRAIEEKLSVRELKDEIRKNEKIYESKELPDKIFNVIYCDPPWKYNNQGFVISAEQHYPTMNIDDLCKMDIKSISAENCVCFMWVTNPILEDGLRLLNNWGFGYKSNFVWVKTNHTPGFYVFGQHEILMIGIKGSFLPTGNKYKSIIKGENLIHSKKPEIVYDIIEKMYPNCKYIELFARNRREGWEVWGNEI